MSKIVSRLALLTELALFLASASQVHAQTLPRSYEASPDVYYVIAQNERFKVVLATWKPGQRDQPHSHPANAIYFVDDCSLRAHAPDGSMRELYTKSGSATVQVATPGHMIENSGIRDCRVVMFEPN